MNKHLLGIIVFFIGMTACAPLTERIREGNTEQGMYKKAKSFYDDEDYEYAITSFEEMLNKHPLTSLSTEVELLIADSMFQLRQYEEAAVSYVNFRKLHPGHEKSDFILRRIADSYYNKSPQDIDRDISDLEVSSQYYTTLLIEFSSSEYAIEARENLKKIRLLFAKRERYIGDFYFKRKKFRAAIDRYLNIPNKYQESEETPEVILQIVKCYDVLNEINESKEWLMKLSSDYPNTKWQKIAKNKLLRYAAKNNSK